jgi:hypothetical protein
MAAPRESQGLQIATIIFAILTIILAVTTYIYYADGEKMRQEIEASKTRVAQVEKQNNLLMYRLRALQYVIGAGQVSRDTVDAAKPPEGDAETAELLREFDIDMAMYAGQAGATEANNYRSLPKFLLSIIHNKQVATVDADAETKRVQAKSASDLAAEQARTKAAEDASAKAMADLNQEVAKFNQDRNVVQQQKEQLATQLAAKEAAIKKEREDNSKALATVSTQYDQVRRTNEVLRDKLVSLNSEKVNRFEAPDGRVTLVNQAQRLVWINLGQKDGLQRQTTFAVFDHDENGVTQAEPKARIEVVRIVGEHLAECRILEDKPANPILQNDIVFTPAWSPGVKVHFALVGFMDINKDGVSDREMIRNFIQMSGGVIDAELHDDGTRTGSMSVDTRYLVLGEKPNERTGTRMLQEYNFMLQEVSKYGTETINVQKLMSMMGVKVEERTVELGSSAAKSEFKRRNPPRPAGVAPAGAANQGAAPAAAPMQDAPAPIDDPFK